MLQLLNEKQGRRLQHSSLLYRKSGGGDTCYCFHSAFWGLSERTFQVVRVLPQGVDVFLEGCGVGVGAHRLRKRRFLRVVFGVVKVVVAGLGGGESE